MPAGIGGRQHVSEIIEGIICVQPSIAGIQPSARLGWIAPVSADCVVVIGNTGGRCDRRTIVDRLGIAHFLASGAIPNGLLRHPVGDA